MAFARSLSGALVDRGVRINGVAPGPAWTPLVAVSFDAKKVAEFGANERLKRVRELHEIAPSYVFLASRDAPYITGKLLHPNGGEVVTT